MAMSPAVHERCTNAVVERKLDELCASLHGALSPPLPRSPDAERLLVAEIKYKIDFLRSFLTAERDCRIGARPAYLVEAEERFAVLKATFDEWARRVVPPLHAAEKEGKQVMEAQDDDDGSGSDCSCTDSCQELTATDRVPFEAPVDVTSDSTDKKCGREQDSVVRFEEVYSPDAAAKKRDTEGAAVVPREEEAALDASPEKRDRERDSVVTREEVTPEAVAKKRDDTEGAAVVPREKEATSYASAKKRDAEHRTKVDTTDSSTDQRRWWGRSAAWCGAAGVLAVVAVGLAVELAAVDHHNVGGYVVPT